MQGLLIKSNDEIYMKDFEEPLYESIRNTLNGFFEIVRLNHNTTFIEMLGRKDFVLLVNDEGLLNNFSTNYVCSCLYKGAIAGDAILMKEGEVYGEPDIIGITKEEAQHFLTVAKAYISTLLFQDYKEV